MCTSSSYTEGNKKIQHSFILIKLNYTGPFLKTKFKSVKWTIKTSVLDSSDTHESILPLCDTV